MKRVTAFVTCDGVVRMSHDAAKAHADARYGAALTKHAHALQRAGGLTGTVAYLEANTYALADLAQLRQDRDTIEGAEDENDN